MKTDSTASDIAGPPQAKLQATCLSGPGKLPYDIVIHALWWLREDCSSLFHCALVDRTFRDAAATYLYGRVTYAPVYNPVLNLKKRDDFAEGLFASARLPHNGGLVRRLEVSGYLSPRPPPLNPFPAQFKAALECWPNIQVLVFAPKQYHASAFTEALPLLLGLQFLRDLVVNPSCTDEDHATTLARLRGLESLTIQSPTRAILQLLPEWLCQLRPTLKRLYLENSCGSVTPGVLRSFLPHMQGITSFALGLSYSLTDNDIFCFLMELPQLQRLEFRYYLQLRPSITPRLSRLRHLTVNYTNVSTAGDAAHLYKWIRRVITHAPLEMLHLRVVSETEVYGAAPTFDPLLQHLSARHAQRLRVLVMRDCFVGRGALRELCARCTNLEQLSVAVSRATLLDFQKLASTLRRLHDVRLNTRNVKYRGCLTMESAEAIMKGVPGLRCLVVDNARFEATWSMSNDGTARYTVTEAKGRVQRQGFPWEGAS